MFQIESSYLQIYRDLLIQPSFVGLPPSYRCVLIALLANACFLPCQQDDHGVLIDLLPGQFMCTIRSLADLANVGKNDAERSLKKFVDFKIVRLEVRHKKTIVTIIWGLRLKGGETRKETNSRQDRDTKQQREEAKASSNVKKQQQDVVVFSCLENLNDPSITQNEKERISKKFPEEIVVKAVKSITKRGFIPQDSLLKALNAALKYEWKPEVVDNKDFKHNLDLAKKLETADHPYKFEALKDVLTISKGVNGESIEIKYKLSKEKFIEELKTKTKINLEKIKWK